MKELYGIDMEKTQYSKLLSNTPNPDIAILMGCNIRCPFIGSTFDENWRLDDLTGKSDIEFKIVIKEIERRILQLREKLK
jgi:arsenate reductase